MDSYTARRGQMFEHERGVRHGHAGEVLVAALEVAHDGAHRRLVRVRVAARERPEGSTIVRAMVSLSASRTDTVLLPVLAM